MFISTIQNYGGDLIKMTDDSFWGSLIYGFKIMGIGVAIVFGVLLVLWLFLEAMGFLVQQLGKSKNKNKNEAIPPMQDMQDMQETEEDEEFVAVIAAAVAAYTGKATSEFKVVSFKKRENWKNGE